MKNVGLLIQEQPKKLNMTQDTLAEKLGVTKFYVSKMENGHTPISLKRLYQIGEILDYEFFALDQSNELFEKWESVIEMFEEKRLSPEDIMKIEQSIDVIKKILK